MLKQLLSILRTATGRKQSFAASIGLWEILGGLIGTLGVLRLFGSVDDSALAKLFFGFALGGCVLSVVAGGALLRGLPLGRYLSLTVQGLQFTQFSFGWCLYSFVIGPNLQLGFTNQGGFWAIIAVAPRVAFQWNGSSQPFAAFNLFACAAFFYLVAISNEDLTRSPSEVVQPTMDAVS
jgi:hypothetical protein